ncbi:hypothetical protein [Argonema antarcticum]|uniref:hypothetical protein n=1 Tax=Argonema antarcticum TaxID=2942763 RepID=UPI0020123C98|nr:hypothetical protein [Argonema antarcticum]MCL1471522.1 hypothetical protein [Argonema antarcticum A004/B2]
MHPLPYRRNLEPVYFVVARHHQYVGNPKILMILCYYSIFDPKERIFLTNSLLEILPISCIRGIDRHPHSRSIIDYLSADRL